MREIKNSGIEWIEKIPKEWDIIKCKYVSDLYTGNSIKDEDKSLYEDSTNAVPYIATKDIDVIFNTINYENGLYIKNDDNSFVRANKNDILMCIEGGSAGRKKAKLDKTVCFVNKLCCFHPVKINSLFLYYILNSPHYEEEFRFNISGLIGGVSKSKLMNFIFPYPLLEEQQKISVYLDEKCTKIDSIIEKQQKIIEKLKTYKLSLITEAVTKGLNPDVKMKDSGVEWIGEIPEHWNTATISKVAKLYNGDRSNNYPSGTDIVDEGILFVTSNNLNNIELDTNIPTNKFITKQKYDSLRGAKLKINDIIFCLRGSVGKCGINYKYNAGTIASSLVCIRSVSINPSYLNYSLHTSIVVEQAKIEAIGIGSQNLSAENIARVIITIPSSQEQQEIADYLDKKCSAIDSAIEKKQALIEKLTEYKKSLIYEVVTGKKEV